MDTLASLNHSVWDCKYHVVFIPKYRRRILYGELRRHLGEVFRQLALLYPLDRMTRRAREDQVPARVASTRLMLIKVSAITPSPTLHASWLNQIEIYFSILQRKALTPNDFGSLADVEDRILGFQQYWEAIATPFDWQFTKDDFRELVRKLDAHAMTLRPAA